MLLHDLFLTETVSTASPQFQAWFNGSKVVDDHGRPLPVYHGTARGDRVGTRFRKSRATAGPMAFFTDDPAIASGYATGKADTSHEPDGDYENWVSILIDNKKVPLAQAWWQLDQADRAALAAGAPHVRREETTIYSDPDTKNGPGNYPAALRAARGNVLLALCDSWLTSGLLFGDEDEFATVLRLAGLRQPVWIFDPRTSMPFVYQVFLCIRNPLVTAAIPQTVIDALTLAANKQRRKTERPGDIWHKNNVDARTWINGLLNKLSREHAWTQIPDWVTNTLIGLGYDGIEDTGGKNGGIGHSVWIPFHENQVKSAISNKRFDPNKSNIHH